MAKKPDKTPPKIAKPAEAKAALEAQFAEADAKGAPTLRDTPAREARAKINAEFDAASDKRKVEIIAETQAVLSVRGF